MENLEALVEAVVKRVFIPLEASGRHVHVTKAQALRLFGHELTAKRPLSQPGQFLANERVTVKGPKGAFENVAVLGPERTEAQVEISLTDGRTVGILPPVRSNATRTDPAFWKARWCVFIRPLLPLPIWIMTRPMPLAFSRAIWGAWCYESPFGWQTAAPGFGLQLHRGGLRGCGHRLIDHCPAAAF